MLLSNAGSSTRTLSGRSVLTADSALKIAAKLGAEISKGRSKHIGVVVRVKGTYIGRYGIRRGSNSGHDYIPRQLQTTIRVALGLARCTHYREDYEKNLMDRGKLPPAPRT